jgi:hypothetical protein
VMRGGCGQHSRNKAKKADASSDGGSYLSEKDVSSCFTLLSSKGMPEFTSKVELTRRSRRGPLVRSS